MPGCLIAKSFQNTPADGTMMVQVQSLPKSLQSGLFLLSVTPVLQDVIVRNESLKSEDIAWEILDILSFHLSCDAFDHHVSNLLGSFLDSGWTINYMSAIATNCLVRSPEVLLKSEDELDKGVSGNMLPWLRVED